MTKRARAGRRSPYRTAVAAAACLFAVAAAAAPHGVASNPAAAGAAFDGRLAPPAGPVPPALFGLNVINLEWGAGWPTVPFYGWRTGHSSWWHLEPARDQWQFGQLDRDVALAQRHHVELLLILDSTPTWASARPGEPGCCGSHAPPGKNAEAARLEDWQRYVRTVAARYRGRVHAYELWNEPNEGFFTGTVAALVELDRVAYQALKQVDPAITVVSPAFTWHGGEGVRYLDRYLALGGAQYADAVGFHFYVAPRPPEAMLPRIQAAEDVLAKHGVAGKPLWNTETGWNILNHDKNPAPEEFAGKPLTDVEAAGVVARSYLLSWAAGVARLYWYTWGDQAMALNEYDGRTPKLAATAYAVAQRWLIGARVTSCASDAAGTWVCELARTGGPARVLWNPGRTVEYTVPGAWDVRRIETVAGTASAPAAASLTVGPSPVLLEGAAP
ncbi:MAG TPA: hypothetical protein VGX75_04065 [bacterium]|nr:hypothetical protein [bacterium]